MKRLLILLFIPTLSYSQITFEDIMNINSEKTFKRVMIENGLEFSKVDTFFIMEGITLWENVSYGLNIKRDEENGDKSSLWGTYKRKNDEFIFQFVRNIDSPYDEIIRKIKRRCKYVDIYNRNDIDFVCYNCSESTYKGVIGFTINKGVGVIQHIIPRDGIDKLNEE